MVLIDVMIQFCTSQVRVVGEKHASVKLPFARDSRVSVLAAPDVTGVFAWGNVEGTFTRQRFHDTFKAKILPFLNPWSLTRSIVVVNNAEIHMYKEPK